MKKIPLIVLLFTALILQSCGEKQVVSQADIDQQKIVDYLISKQLTATATASGLHYIIIDEGSGDKPTTQSTVTVSYKGYLLDDTLFDQGTFFTSPLSDLIKGWQEGIPLIAPGGKIKLIIPSALGYGGHAAGSIPANSVIVFDVSLHYFSN
ncbi:MAG: FKBP-type peptidyl-prolyl cis-trans isomerase [Bacteroidetes bacterium]|nr:FKBP-type peptidyl-prolyl cis-trans isomerase [Bacteroidota bacterium]